MKTPVQELYERLWEAEKDKFVWAAILKDTLDKEKEVMKQAFIQGDWGDYFLGIEDESFEYYYNKTFNTK